MNVVQILPHMNIGGVERGVVDLAGYFKNSDIQTMVISGGGRLVEKLNQNGVTHYSMPVYKKSPALLFLIPKLRKFLVENNVDIIHGRSRMPAWIAFFASRGTRSDFITTAHGVYKSKFFSEVMGWGKFVICPSQTVARHMRENFAVPEEKIVIINRWVDINRFRFNDYNTRKESNTIVSIGRISPSKGYEYLIEGFKKILRFNPYLNLKIVGSPEKSKQDYFKDLKIMVNRLSLNHNIEFAGFRNDVENILKDARILVASSVIDESFGRVIIEAFACGVPVVATRVGGFNEIIDHEKTGILVEPKNSASIAEGILKILNNHKLSNTIVNTAKQTVENLYTMEKNLQETAQLYRKCANFQRILVIKISSLGDIILVLPALKELKERFPAGKISLLTLKKYSPLLYGCPYLDEVISIDQNYKKINKILGLAKSLRRKSFDYIIDFQNSRSSHLLSWLAFPRQSFGYSVKWGGLLQKKQKINRKDDPLTSQEKILQLLGARFKKKELVFWEVKETKNILPKEGNFIGINIAASARWDSKNWPVENISQLIEILNKNFPSFEIVLFGDKDTAETARVIENKTRLNPLNLCGKTSLGDLPEAIKKMKVFVTPDTATLHLAVALGTETIALFGPTDPARHTVPAKNLFIVNKKLPCSSCYRPVCKIKEKNLCMKKITPQEVFLKVKTVIEGK